LADHVQLLSGAFPQAPKSDFRFLKRTLGFRFEAIRRLRPHETGHLLIQWVNLIKKILSINEIFFIIPTTY